jgi:hypothetical protein
VREIVLYKATVIDDNDPKKLSRVQIRVLPEMKDVQAKYLPWAVPHGGEGMASDNMTHNPPEKNSHIWVYFLDKYFKSPYYIGARFIQGLCNYSGVTTSLGSITEIGSMVYPNPRFILHKDGTIEFHNSVTGAHGVYHKSGSYMIFDPSGNIYISKGTNKIKMETTGITIETGDAITWKPNTLPNCVFSGAPHCAITKLKGA